MEDDPDMLSHAVFCCCFICFSSPNMDMGCHLLGSSLRQMILTHGFPFRLGAKTAVSSLPGGRTVTGIKKLIAFVFHPIRDDVEI